MRHDPALAQINRQQKKEEEKVAAEEKATPRDAKKAAKAPKVGAKKDKKSELQVLESNKRPESKSQKNATDPRDSYRPKAFTKEEKDAWKV